MRLSIVTIALVAIAASASVEHHSPESVFLDAQSDISAMKKKGASLADCKDLAKTSCQEVLGEVSNAQKLINKQTTGAECDALGEKAYLAAKKRYNTLVTQLFYAKRMVQGALDEVVRNPYQKFKNLKRGKCGFVFSSSAYLKIQRLYNHARKRVSVLIGKVSEAKTTMKIAFVHRNKLRYDCRCKVLKRRNRIWKTVNSSRARQQKALSKCTMMKCVLNGTPITSSKCKAVLPKLKNKVLSSVIEWSHKTGICRRKWQREKNHKAAVKAEKAQKRHEQNTKKEIRQKAAAKERKVKAHAGALREKLKVACTRLQYRNGRLIYQWSTYIGEGVQFYYEPYSRWCPFYGGIRMLNTGAKMKRHGMYTGDSYSYKCIPSCLKLNQQICGAYSAAHGGNKCNAVR